MSEVAMKNRLGSEAKLLLHAPLTALRDFHQLLTGTLRDQKEGEDTHRGKVLIDKDGNATLNLNNKEVQDEIRQHIEALADIEVTKPDVEDTKGQHSKG